jgi:hypothetical protein
MSRLLRLRVAGCGLRVPPLSFFWKFPAGGYRSLNQSSRYGRRTEWRLPSPLPPLERDAQVGRWAGGQVVVQRRGSIQHPQWRILTRTVSLPFPPSASVFSGTQPWARPRPSVSALTSVYRAPFSFCMEQVFGGIDGTLSGRLLLLLQEGKDGKDGKDGLCIVRPASCSG